MKDSSLSFSLGANYTGSSNVNVGVFTFDSDFNILSEKVFQDITNSTLTSFESQNFTAGDMIGVWVEVDGEKRFSVHELNGNGVTQDGWVLKDGNLSLGMEFDSPVYNGKDNLDIWLDITGKVPSAPSGQPLPGVCATLAICGACAGGLKFFKRAK